MNPYFCIISTTVKDHADTLLILGGKENIEKKAVKNKINELSFYLSENGGFP